VSILTFILVFVVAGILWWAAKAILYAPGIVIADPFRTVLYVLIVVVICLFALQTLFGVLPGVPRLRL
jgi:hypothetical protein